MTKAVIFDLDGLLFDSEITSFKIYKEIGDRFGFEFTLDDFTKNFSGQPLMRNVPYAIEKYHIPWSLEEALKEIDIIETRLLSEGIELKPGAKELLEYLKQNNYKTIVASSSVRDRAINLLTQHGIVDLFDEFVFGPEVKRGKPNPDIFLKAAEKLGETPENCLVLEDSEAGIQAAYSANIPVICIPDLKRPSEEFENKTVAVLKSLDEVRIYLNKN
ncbi:MAG: HAD family phosphatase [Agathobacter sp.]|nr:HAD family phosphatase [Agathobacter sp.]